MKVIGAVSIGKLIQAHYEKDEKKFKSYAEFIVEAYKERSEERAERIIRSKIDGTYRNKPAVVTLDNKIEEAKEIINIATEGIKRWGIVEGTERPFKKQAEMLFNLFLDKSEQFLSEVEE